METQDPAYSFGYATGVFFTIIIVGALYFLPGWLGRKKRQATPIFLLNLFLGWTAIGWLAALIWALSADTPPVAVQVVNTPTRSVADELTKLRQLYEQGAITEAEYNTQKARLLA